MWQDLFIGGTGTASEAILWTIAELINHPNAFNKLREEIKSIFGNNRLVEESDISNLPCLQAVVKEGLRLNPHFLYLLYNEGSKYMGKPR